MVSTNEKQTNRKNSFSYELYYLSEKSRFDKNLILVSCL